MFGLLFGCSGDANDDPYTLPEVYWVEVTTAPSPPIAGEVAEVYLDVRNTDGAVTDLTETHERMVHTFVVSRDLRDFAHLHHEDFYQLTGEDLLAARFHFPYRFPTTGEHVLSFEFANRGEYRAWRESVIVGGDIPQSDAAPELSTRAEAGGVRGELVWDIPPVLGGESAFHLYLTDDTGAEVTDLVQYLGADGHAAIVQSEFKDVGHTHAWVTGMNAMPPGHEMPHLYPGPDLPFRYTFRVAGRYKLWAQFARAADPETPYTLPFVIDVEG